MSSFKLRVRQKIGALGEDGNFTLEILSKLKAVGSVGALYNHWRGCLCHSLQHHEEAVVWFERGAEGGNRYSQYNLGCIYTFGQGVEKDETEAAKWYELSAEGRRGFSHAQNNLGLMYEQGQGGLPIDREKAVELYRMSANEHNSAAEANLGRMYHLGQGGLERNLREAEKWYKKSALHGSKCGQYSLACLYEYGGEEVHDHQKALDWFRLSASQGHLQAQQMLRYFSGKGYHDENGN